MLPTRLPKLRAEALLRNPPARDLDSHRMLAAKNVEPVEGSITAAAPVRMHPVLSAALWLVACGLIAGWLALLSRHLNDDYRITHNSGVWIAVADGARVGRLYPPIFDGAHYAGTRYMPLPILLNALASAVVGDPLVGGKLLAGVLMAILLALVVVALRRFACPLAIAVALAAVIVGTETGLQAGSSIGGDLLPALLQVAALVVVTGGATRRRLLIAAAFAGLGAASKLTGVWALFAITSWLLIQRDWRRAATFAVGGGAVAASILVLVQVLSGGGLTAHLSAFSVAGVRNLIAFARGPNQVLYQLLGYAAGAVVLVPLAVIGTLLGGWRQVSVIHLAMGYALMLLLVVYADVGTGFNQLLDFVVLTVLAVGYLAGRAPGQVDPQTRRVVLLTVTVTVLWAGCLDLVRTVAFDLRRSISGSVPGHNLRSARLAASRVGPDQEVLAEDPSIYVALGRQPLVMDPFMITRLDRVHPEQVDPLISWISSRRFDTVFLVVSLEDRDVEYWWNDFHFGPRVAAALRKNYRPDGLIGRYYVYKPRP
jgi:hypothetical protein